MVGVVPLLVDAEVDGDEPLAVVIIGMVLAGSVSPSLSVSVSVSSDVATGAHPSKPTLNAISPNFISPLRGASYLKVRVRLELHCHSDLSDGSFPAEDVARRAAAWGVRLFCLTDHDTCEGYERTRDALADAGVQVLRGVELSCREFGRTIHVLMYGLQNGDGLDRLRERMQQVIEARAVRLRLICERLATLGVELDADEILRTTHGVPGRPDVARALVTAGVCTSPREAFKRFLHDGGPADVAIERLSVEEGVALGRAAGAKMALAHPHALGEPALVRELFRRHRDAGLDGLEAFYGKYARAESRAWLRLADDMNLTATGGSDFHGDMAPRNLPPRDRLPRRPHSRTTRLAGLAGRVVADLEQLVSEKRVHAPIHVGHRNITVAPKASERAVSDAVGHEGRP